MNKLPELFRLPEPDAAARQRMIAQTLARIQAYGVRPSWRAAFSLGEMAPLALGLAAFLAMAGLVSLDISDSTRSAALQSGEEWLDDRHEPDPLTLAAAALSNRAK